MSLLYKPEILLVQPPCDFRVFSKNIRFLAYVIR